MWATFNRFEIQMTRREAESASHPGPCDSDVAALTAKLRKQLDELDPEEIALELKDYGAWDAKELADHEANLRRIVWIAAGNIMEGS
jgi:hypothetical protein